MNDNFQKIVKKIKLKSMQTLNRPYETGIYHKKNQPKTLGSIPIWRQILVVK